MFFPILPRNVVPANPEQPVVATTKRTPALPAAMLDTTPALPDRKLTAQGKPAPAPAPSKEKAKLSNSDRSDAATTVGALKRDIFGNKKVFDGDSANKHGGTRLANDLKKNPRTIPAVMEALNDAGMRWAVLIADMDVKKTASLVGDIGRFIPAEQMKDVCDVLFARGMRECAGALLGQPMRPALRTAVALSLVEHGMTYEHVMTPKHGCKMPDAAWTSRAFCEVLSARNAAIKDMFDAFDASPKTAFRSMCEVAGISREDLQATILTGKEGLPRSVKDFFQEKANRGHGHFAAAGAMILRAEAGAAEVFAAGARKAAEEAEDVAEKARFQKDADSFANTAKKDAAYVKKFDARAKGVYVGVTDLRSV